MIDGDSQFRINSSNVPVGTILAFSGSDIPDGFLLCNGSELNRADYSELFDSIGESYGAGDGNTTFNIPNTIDKVVQGGTVGEYKEAGLPNITGGLGQNIQADVTYATGTGVFRSYVSTKYGGTNSGSNHAWQTFDFYASRSNSIYGNSTTVQPPAVCMNLIIKY